MRLALRLFALGAVLLAGCSSYIPPGARADLQAFAPGNIREGFAAKPVAPFPAAVAVVRVQAPDYSNYYLRAAGGVFGKGRYSVVTTREVEDDAQIQRLAGLPKVAALTGISRMLLPENLQTDKEIREAASRLQADMVFLYTFDTAFFDTDVARPLTVITLGLSPTRRITATTTVSALLLDTRTGYVYASFDATSRTETLSTSWGSSDTADEARRHNEKDAFGKLVDAVVAAWPALLQRYDKRN